MRHQSSVLTSLHPSAGNLHSNHNLTSQSILNIQDGGADRSKQWLTRVVSHQQVVHDWLNNTGTDLPEFIHKSCNIQKYESSESSSEDEFLRIDISLNHCRSKWHYEHINCENSRQEICSLGLIYEVKVRGNVGLYISDDIQ